VSRNVDLVSLGEIAARKEPQMTGQARETTPRRLKILGEDEIEALYGRPAFTPDERVQYFTVSQPESEVLQEFRSVKSQTYFLLQLGYFKAKHLFFYLRSLRGARRPRVPPRTVFSHGHD
jgi:hypothetical protein